MILSQKKIEEIAVAVIRDFQKSFFGSEADDPARFALPTPIDQFASDYLNLKVSFQKLSSDGSIYGLTAYVDTEYQIEVDGSQRSIFLKTNDVVLDKSFIEPENIRKLCGKRRFTLAHECAHQILFQLDSDDRKIACHKRPEVRGNGSRVLRTQEVSIGTNRSRYHILPQYIPHYTVSSSLNRAEKDKLPGSRLQKEIKDPTRQSRIDIKIYLSCRLILRIMCFTGQMDDGIKVR